MCCWAWWQLAAADEDPQPGRPAAAGEPFVQQAGDLGNLQIIADRAVEVVHRRQPAVLAYRGDGCARVGIDRPADRVLHVPVGGVVLAGEPVDELVGEPVRSSPWVVGLQLP